MVVPEAQGSDMIIMIIGIEVYMWGWWITGLAILGIMIGQGRRGEILSNIWDIWVLTTIWPLTIAIIILSGRDAVSW